MTSRPEVLPRETSPASGLAPLVEVITVEPAVAQQLVDAPHDFTVDESMDRDPKKISWVANQSEADERWLATAGRCLVTLGSPGYPALLAAIDAAPPTLFVEGAAAAPLRKRCMPAFWPWSSNQAEPSMSR